jgi:MFS family permease
MAARFARSLGQGALVAGFTLYLHALGWRAAPIGALLSAALLFGVGLTALIGPASDRVGRKPFLLAYEGVMIACAALALCSSATWALTLGAILGGFGRGANGAAGPFGPLEQAWLSQGLAPSQRARVFSLNSTLGFAGMAVGALLAALPSAWARLWPGPTAFRPLFALPLLGSAIGMILISLASDPGQSKPSLGTVPGNAHRGEEVLPEEVRRSENRHLLRLAIANSLNGFGIGLVAPLMAYWFLRRYGHGPGSIGPALALGFVLASFGGLVAARISARMGVVRTVVAMRGVGLLLMVLTPLMPIFGLAAGLWAVRAAFNQGTLGVRQSLAMGLTHPGRRGLAATVNNISLQVPRAIGPAMAGLMLHRGWLTAPFLAAGAFQLAFLLVYHRFFGAIEAAEAATSRC